VLVSGAALGGGAVAHAQTPAGTTTPPPNELVNPQPGPPDVQGTPGQRIPGLPCGVRGPALDLGDHSRYPKARGTLKAAMVFVDFPDSPAGPDQSPDGVYNRLVPDAQRKLSELSYGKLKLTVASSGQWVRMPKTPADYGFAQGDFNSSERFRLYDEYVAAAMRLAGAQMDLSKYQVVYIVAGPGANTPQATQNTRPREGIKAGKARVEHVVTLNGFGSSYYGVTLHETGHTLGLPDLYEVGAASNWDRFAGPWDSMGEAWRSLPMMSWTRRLVGWLGDKDFRCVRKSTTVRLAPVTASRGIRGAVVRTGSRSAYIVEARTDEVGPGCPTGGVLVYRWNGQVTTGKGPIRVFDGQPDDGLCGSHTNALVEPFGGGRTSYTDKKVAVSVLSAGPSGYRVKIRPR
jgi:M6 family metalloprotease-like protein